MVFWLGFLGTLRQVESLTIRTSTGKKLKVESIFISYPRLLARIQEEVDSAHLSNMRNTF